MAAKSWAGQNATGSQGILRSTTNATGNKVDVIPVMPGDRTFVLHAVAADIDYNFDSASDAANLGTDYDTVLAGTKESIAVRGLANLAIASAAGGDTYVVKRDADVP